MTSITKITNLTLVASMMLVIFVAALPVGAQATILTLQNADFYSASPFRSSPIAGVDANWSCNFAGGSPPTLTGSGTLHDVNDWTQGGCDVEMGTSQPASVFGFVFRISSYSTAYTSVFEYDNSGNPSAVSNGGNKPPVQTVCITTPANSARVGTEITCDVIDTTFTPGVNNVWVQMNGKRSPGAANTDEAITFIVDNIQWIVETTPTPTPTPGPTPPPPDLPQDPDGSGVSGVCYECISPANIFNVPMWIAKLICVIRNLFQCQLRIWLENISNLIRNLFDTLVVVITWLADTWQGFIDWIFSIFNTVLTFFTDTWDLLIDGVTGLLQSIFDQIYQSALVQGLLNSSWIAGQIFETFRTLVLVFVDLATSLYDAVFLIVDILVDIALALFAAPNDIGPADIESDLGIVYNVNDLEADGFNGTKVIWLILSTLFSVDSALGVQGFGTMRIVIIGVLSFTLLIWTIDKWKDIIPN